MDRLTVRNSEGIGVLKQPYQCERCGELRWSLPDLGNGSPIDRLAEYEDLEEKGMLLKLPCETVWFITDNHSKYATVWGKPIKSLSINEIEGIDKKGHYYSAKEKAEEMLEKS